jgi:hypothetical protein
MWWLIGWDVGTGLTNRMWIGMWRLIGRAYGWDEMATRLCFGHFICGTVFCGLLAVMVSLIG